MLFILRKLRKSFFLPGKARTYLAYAIGEIALIVVGILIAVQIGDWNDRMKLRAEEIELLEKMESEFEVQIEESERIYSNNIDLSKLGVRFMESHLNHEDANFDIEDYVRLGDYHPVNIHINSLEVALQGDKNNLIESDSLVDSLRQLKANLIVLEDDTKYLNQSWESQFLPYQVELGLSVERYKYYHSDNKTLDPAILDKIDDDVLANKGAYHLGIQQTWTKQHKVVLEDMRTILRKVQEQLAK